MKFLRDIFESIFCVIYVLLGKKPNTGFCRVYKEREVSRHIISGLFDPALLKPGHGKDLDERLIEYPWLFALLPETKGKLLDAGSVLNLSKIINHSKLANKEVTIFTLAPERVSFWNKGISYVYGDLRNTYFKDDTFDWIVSLSTIEHIGLDNTKFYTVDTRKNENDKESFAGAIKEFRRILKPNGILFLSVPYGKYQNLGWLQNFDATMIERIIQLFKPAEHREYYYKYHSAGWGVSSKCSAADAEYMDLHTNKYLRGVPISAGAVVCMWLKK